MIKATVNQNSIFEIAGNTVNGAEKTIDIQKINEHEYHLLIDNKSFRGNIVSYNSEEKKMVLLINGKELEIELKDKTDLLLEQMGLNSATASKQNILKAPMPGLIRQVNVSEGQHVKKGDVLIILEAMKMENALKAAADAIVKNIVVVTGQTVEKNQLLVEMA